jgi:hypothetical protein
MPETRQRISDSRPASVILACVPAITRLQSPGLEHRVARNLITARAASPTLLDGIELNLRRSRTATGDACVSDGYSAFPFAPAIDRVSGRRLLLDGQQCGPCHSGQGFVLLQCTNGGRNGSSCDTKTCLPSRRLSTEAAVMGGGDEFSTPEIHAIRRSHSGQTCNFAVERRRGHLFILSMGSSNPSACGNGELLHKSDAFLVDGRGFACSSRRTCGRNPWPVPRGLKFVPW